MRVLAWVSHDQVLQKLDRRVHRLIIRNILERKVHEVNFTHLVGKTTFCLILFQNEDEV